LKAEAKPHSLELLTFGEKLTKWQFYDLKLFKNLTLWLGLLTVLKLWALGIGFALS